MRKRKLYFLLCISSIIIIAAFSTINLFNNKYIIQELNSQDNKSTIYFSATLFNKNIFGETQKSNILKTKVLDIGSNLLYPPELVKLDKDQWVILIHKNSISIYSVMKNKTYKFNVSNANILSGCISTLALGNKYNILLLLSKTAGKYAEDLMILSLVDGKDKIQFKTICNKSLKTMKPWKIQTCDVDGDGKKEISIGMYKTTKFNPVLAKRPFIYQWTGKDIAPKWLGSRLSKPFEDYIFMDLNQDGKDELVSIEILENGKKVISAYAWKGFGFELIGESSEFQDILEIRKINENKEKMKLIINTKYENKLTNYYIELRDGKLIAKKVNN
jgi:hypothetical protein